MFVLTHEMRPGPWRVSLHFCPSLLPECCNAYLFTNSSVVIYEEFPSSDRVQGVELSAGGQKNLQIGTECR